ncbi:TPA: hypothetical protein MA058_003453 [Klebsiella pneumoniae]|nr:hypothetical protein [Klebsiella pneumoniae]
MIKHLTQPTKDSCMSTCLAMVVGISAKESYDKYHTKLQKYEIWFDTILDEYKIPYYYGSPRSSRLSGTVLCFATVPSLNIQGVFHQILIQYEEGKFTVFDPAQGRGGAKYYIPSNQKIDNELQVHLESWLIDLVIPLVYK